MCLSQYQFLQKNLYQSDVILSKITSFESHCFRKKLKVMPKVTLKLKPQYKVIFYISHTKNLLKNCSSVVQPSVIFDVIKQMCIQKMYIFETNNEKSGSTAAYTVKILFQIS